MDTLSPVSGNKRNYFILLGIVLFSAFIFWLICGKTLSFFLLNTYHTFWLNVFFVNYTFLGDGVFALAIVCVCFFYFRKRNIGLQLLATFLFSGIIVQLIKNIVNAPRPSLFFEKGQYLHFIEGVHLSNHYSFPSGHTATAFALATMFVLISPRKSIQIPVLAAALLVGYSRIYLAQHFLEDVLVGAIIGTASSVAVYYTIIAGTIRQKSKSKWYWLYGNKDGAKQVSYPL